MKEKEQKAAAAKLEEARAKAAEKENSDKNEDTTAKE